jgi:energy-coupling factor transporter ATP-binding protein EcfA2
MSVETFKIESVEIEGLYGRINKSLVFPDGNISVLIGDNGFGKSTILRLLSLVFSFPTALAGRGVVDSQLLFLRSRGRDLLLSPIYDSFFVGIRSSDGSSGTIRFFAGPVNAHSTGSKTRSLLKIDFQEKGYSNTFFPRSLDTDPKHLNEEEISAQLTQEEFDIISAMHGLERRIFFSKNRGSFSTTLIRAERVVNNDFNLLVNQLMSLALDNSSITADKKGEILKQLEPSQGKKESAEFGELLYRNRSVFGIRSVFSDSPSKADSSSLDIRPTLVDELLFSKGPFFLGYLYDMVKFAEKELLFARSDTFDWMCNKLDEPMWRECMAHPDDIQDAIENSDYIKGKQLNPTKKQTAEFSPQFFVESHWRELLERLETGPRHHFFHHLSADCRTDGPIDINDIQRFFRSFIQDTSYFLDLVWSYKEMKFLFDVVFQNESSHCRLVFTEKKMLSVEWADGQITGLNTLSSGQYNAFKLFYEVLIGRFRSSMPSSIVLIDEPEISLHIAWQKQIIPQLRYITDALGFQVIVATQSPFVLDGDESLLIREKV